jgi:Leucine-rich repeat (LRR) protein
MMKMNAYMSAEQQNNENEKEESSSFNIDEYVFESVLFLLYSDCNYITKIQTQIKFSLNLFDDKTHIFCK